MLTDVFEMFGASFLSVLTLMSILWVISYYKKNAGIVDIGWALGFILTAWCCFFLGEGVFMKRLVVALMVTVWAGRLAYHLISRFDIKTEDPRYQVIRSSMTSERAEMNLLMLFLFQGVLVVILSTPFVVISADVAGEWYWYAYLALFIWGIGVSGETVADYQLRKFKRDPQNKGKVCQEGLWNYSRHPNYFFEFVIWVSFFTLAYSSPLGSVAIIAPALMFYLLYYISGVPLSEKQALETKGDAYREYQKTTSMFVPWFKQ